MASTEQEVLLEKAGYIQCQMDVSDHLQACFNDITVRLKELEAEIVSASGLLIKQKKVSELMKLTGQATSFKELLRFVSNLKHAASNH